MSYENCGISRCIDILNLTVIQTPACVKPNHSIKAEHLQRHTKYLMFLNMYDLWATTFVYFGTTVPWSHYDSMQTFFMLCLQSGSNESINLC